ESLGRAVSQCGQDHHRLYRKRRLRRDEQDYRRHHKDGGASAGLVRNTQRHAAKRTVRQGATYRRQITEAGGKVVSGVVDGRWSLDVGRQQSLFGRNANSQRRLANDKRPSTNTNDKQQILGG